MFKKTKKRQLQDELDKLVDKLSTMDVKDPDYDRTVEAVAKLQGIIDKSKESKSKAGKDSGSAVDSIMGGLYKGAMILLTAALGFTAYKIDQSNELIHNKNSLNLFNKIWKT